MTCIDGQDREIEDKYGEICNKRVEEGKRKARRYVYFGEKNRTVCD